MKNILNNSWWAILVYMVLAPILIYVLSHFMDLIKHLGFGKDKIVWSVLLFIALLIVFHDKTIQYFFDNSRDKGVAFLVILSVLIGAYITVQEMRKDRLLSIRPHIVADLNDAGKRLSMKNIGKGPALIKNIYWNGKSLKLSKGQIDIPADGEQYNVSIEISYGELKNIVMADLIIEYNNIGDSQPLCYKMLIGQKDEVLSKRNGETIFNCQKSIISNLVKRDL